MAPEAGISSTTGPSTRMGTSPWSTSKAPPSSTPAHLTRRLAPAIANVLAGWNFVDDGGVIDSKSGTIVIATDGSVNALDPGSVIEGSVQLEGLLNCRPTSPCPRGPTFRSPQQPAVRRTLHLPHRWRSQQHPGTRDVAGTSGYIGSFTGLVGAAPSRRR